jgi:hypothetical protein
MSYEGSHLSPEERAAAHHPHVGDGTPETAPERDADEFTGPRKSWIPTNKWFAALVTGCLAIVGHSIASEGWDATEWGELVALGISLAGAYFIPNDPTPGGVPVK